MRLLITSGGCGGSGSDASRGRPLRVGGRSRQASSRQRRDPRCRLEPVEQGRGRVRDGGRGIEVRSARAQGPRPRHERVPDLGHDDHAARRARGHRRQPRHQAGDVHDGGLRRGVRGRGGGPVRRGARRALVSHRPAGLRRPRAASGAAAGVRGTGSVAGRSVRELLHEAERAPLRRPPLRVPGARDEGRRVGHDARRRASLLRGTLPRAATSSWRSWATFRRTRPCGSSASGSRRARADGQRGGRSR